MYRQRFIKHGNSLAVVVPVEVVRHLGIKRGDFCDLKVTIDEEILIKKPSGGSQEHGFETSEEELSHNPDE